MKMWDRLERAWKEMGLTQSEFEAKLGFPENRISKWKGGQGQVSPEQLARMAKASQ